MQRRDFIQSIGICGGLAVLWPAMSGLAMEALAQPAAPAQTAIEPITIRRRGVGLRGYDPDRAFPGFTLFAPLPSTNKTVYLVDMHGNVVHTWNMPYPPGHGVPNCNGKSLLLVGFPANE